MHVGGANRWVWTRCTASANLLYSDTTSVAVRVTEMMPLVLWMPVTWPALPLPLMTWRSTFVSKSATRSRKITSSNGTGDCSSNWIATSC
jgi:hypothetical protein